MNNLNLFISSLEILEQDSSQKQTEVAPTPEKLNSQKIDDKNITIQMNAKIQTLLSTLTKDPVSDKNLDFDKEEDRKTISQTLEKLTPEAKNTENYKTLTSYITEYNTNKESAKKASDSTQLQINASLLTLKQQIAGNSISTDKNKTTTQETKVESNSEVAETNAEKSTEVLPFDQIKNKVSEAPKGQVITKLNSLLTVLTANPKSRIPWMAKRWTPNEDSLWIQKSINMVNGADTLDVDGVFGNKSFYAVKDFQTSQNLKKIDGKAGQETVKALIKEITGIVPNSNTAPINQANTAPVAPAVEASKDIVSNPTVEVESTKVVTPLEDKILL